MNNDYTKKTGKKRLYFIFMLVVLFSVSLIFAACSGDSYKLTVSGPKEYFVDYGEWFDVPAAEIRNNSDALTGVSISFAVYNENNEKVTVYSTRYKPDIGKFTIVYSSEGYSDVSIKMECGDMKGPAVSMSSAVVSGANLGDVIFIPGFTLIDPSGVDHSKTDVAVLYNGNETVTVTADGEGKQSFITEKIGLYSIVITAEDLLGNVSVTNIDIICTDAFTDGSLAETSLMNFNESGYERIIYTVSGSAPYSVVTSGLPNGAGGSPSTGGMLKIDLAQDSLAKLFFNGFKQIDLSGDLVDTICFSVYSEKVLSEFTVYGPDGKTVYLTKKFSNSGWRTFSFDAKNVIGWNGSFQTFYITIGSEDAGSVFIDEIYYTTAWKDTNLAPGVIANFDVEQYLGVVGQNQYASSSTFSIVQKSAVTNPDLANGMSGGALKIAISENLGGYAIKFGEPIAVAEIGSLTIRKYFENFHAGYNSRWGFITERGEYTVAMWGNLAAGIMGVTGWNNYVIGGAAVEDHVKRAGGEYITGIYYGYYATEAVSTNVYVDEISYTTRYAPASFNQNNAAFGGKTLMSFEDENTLRNISNLVSHNNTGTYPQSIERVFYSGNWTLELSYNSWPYYGVTYTLPASLSLVNIIGVPLKGWLWVEAEFNSAVVQPVVITVNDSRLSFSGAQAGVNIFAIPLEQLYVNGVLEMQSIGISVAASYLGYYNIIGAWYDEVMPFTAAEYGSTATIESKSCTLIANMGGTQYAAAFTRTAYKTAGYGNTPPATVQTVAQGEKITFAPGYSGLEYRTSSPLTKTVGLTQQRYGNELIIEINVASALTGTLTYGALASSAYKALTAAVSGGDAVVVHPYITDKLINPSAGKHKLSISVPELMENGGILRGIVLAGDFAAGADIIIERMYFSPYVTMLNSPVPSYTRSGNDIVLSWASVSGATGYTIQRNGITVATQSTRTLVVAQSGLYTVTATGSGGPYSPAAKIYVDTEYLTNNAAIGGYVLATFDDPLFVEAGSIRQVVGKPGSNTQGIAPSAFGHYTNVSNGAYFSGVNALRVNTTAIAWNSAQGWGGWTYDFPSAVSVSVMSKIGVRIVYPDQANSRFDCAYFGIIADGKVYQMHSETKSYVSYQKYLSGGALGAETKLLDVYNADTNAYGVLVWLDIAAFLADNPGVTNVQGVYNGIYKTYSYGVDSIFYTLEALAAPAVSISHAGSNLNVSITGDSSGDLEVYLNGVKQSVAGYTFSTQITTDTVIKAQSVTKNAAAILSSPAVTKYVGSDYLSDVSGTYGAGAYLIESFTSANSLTNVSMLAGNPYVTAENDKGRPVVAAALAHNTSFVNNYYTSNTGTLQVTNTHTLWTNWSGYTYNFAQALSTAGVQYVAIDVVTSGWGLGDSYWFGILGSDGTAYAAMPYVSYILANNVNPVSYAGNSKTTIPLDVSGFGGYKEVDTLGGSLLRALIFIDVAAFAAANPGVDIAGVYQGALLANSVTYINSIYYIAA